MSNLKRAGIAAIILGIIATPFIISNNSGAESSVYMDYSTLDSTIDEAYASSKIYYTDNTKITVKKAGSDSSTTGAMSTSAYPVEPGRELVILIEDSTARDANGNKVDVIWRVNNVKYYESIIRKSDESDVSEGTTRSFSLHRSATNCGSTASYPTEDDCANNMMTLGPGDPIVFWLNTHFATADFTVQYIKKGSFNNSTMTGTPAGINKLTYMAYDFDVPNDNYTISDSYFDGDEGVIIEPSSAGQTTFYYHKNQQDVDTKMYEKHNGLAVRSLGHSASFNGIYWGGSYFGLVKNLRDSKYTIKYSATGAGTAYFFGSPVAYDTPGPAKYFEDEEGESSDENRATTNTEFNYYISQYVPELFSSDNDILSFASLWSKYNNIKRDRNYASFSIHDNIDANILLPSYTDVKVMRTRDGIETDVTNKFNVVISGQDINVTAKASALKEDSFYGARYIVTIPVKTKNVIAAAEIPNQATTSFTNTGASGKTKTSNTVITKTYHKLVTRHVDKETGKEISDTTTEEYDHGYEYTTDKASDLPTGYQLIETPENATGILNSDVTVIYYYNIPKNPSTLDRDLVPFAITLGSTAVVAAGLFYFTSKRR